MRLSLLLICPMLALLVGAGCASPSADQDVPETRHAPEGPYLGQTPPASEPELFASGLVSTGMHTRDFAMTPDGDEIYFSVQAGPFATILGSRLEEGAWTPPDVAPFAADPTTMEIEPHISPDGSRFYFVSNRPAEERTMPEAERGQWNRADIWAMDRTEDGWGAPYRLPGPVNTEALEFFPSAAADGTLYFTREDPETGRNFIYRARRDEGGSGHDEPQLLPDRVNSANQFNAFVSPDESFLILGVFGRDDSEGGTDYYVVFRSDDDTWSEPVNLGPTINQPRGQEWSPYVSPDGRYFFFMSTRQPYPEDVPGALTRDWLLDFHVGPESGNPSIYWMDAGFIEALRVEAFAPNG